MGGRCAPWSGPTITAPHRSDILESTSDGILTIDSDGVVTSWNNGLADMTGYGADVFVGDLLNVADVAAALRGCRRVYFSMSLSPYYVDANLLMAATARAQGDLEVFVNMSESEQTNLTFDRMTASEDDRASWFGGRAL